MVTKDEKVHKSRTKCEHLSRRRGERAIQGIDLETTKVSQAGLGKEVYDVVWTDGVAGE